MQVVRVKAKMVSGTSGLKRIRGYVDDMTLEDCWHCRLPWLGPSKIIPSDEGVYTGPSPVAYFRQWNGEPGCEALTYILADNHFYESGFPQPDLNADNILRFLLDKNRRVLSFDGQANPGLVMASVEDYSVDEGYDVEAHVKAGTAVMVPEQGFMQLFTNEIDARTATHMNMGWSKWKKVKIRTDTGKVIKKDVLDLHKNYAFVEFRYWDSKTDLLVQKLASFDGRIVVGLRAGRSRIITTVFVNEGSTPIKQDSGPIASGLLEKGFWFAMPVKKDRALRQMRTPLWELDQFMISRAGIWGRITIPVICNFVNPRLGTSAKSIDDLAEVLGEYFEEIEDDLVEALDPPRLVVAGEATKDTVDVPEAQELVQIQDSVRKLFSASHEASGWVLMVLSRVAVVMHSRQATIFDKQYRSKLFKPSDLIASILRSRKSDNSQYLTNMVLVSDLGTKRKNWAMRMIKEDQQVELKPNPLADIGVSADDLFG